MSNEKRKDKLKRGINIRALSIIMFATASLAMLLSLFELQQTISHANSLYELERERQVCDRAIQQMMDGSDYLTTQIQQYVIHGDRKYMDNYWYEIDVTKSRDNAIETISNADLTAAEKAAAETSKRNSDSLVQGEIWAMRMVSDSIGLAVDEMPVKVAEYNLNINDATLPDIDKRDAAISYVFGPAYSIAKDSIREKVNDFRNEISNRYADETMAALGNTERTTYLMVIGIAVFFIFLIGSIYSFTSFVVSPLTHFSEELAKHDAGKFVNLKEKGAMEIRQFARSFNELSHQVEQNTKRLARLGYIDYLTDVPNRASITEYVSGLILAQRQPVGLMIIDIDNFKHFNDTYGHALGDKVLRCVAQAVCSVQSAASGISGRLCGEEFIVVTCGADEKTVEDTANAILDKVRNITADDVGLPGVKNFKITVSAGGMIWRGEIPADFTSLLARADKALYVSKKTGKDKYTFNENL